MVDILTVIEKNDDHVFFLFFLRLLIMFCMEWIPVEGYQYNVWVHESWDSITWFSNVFCVNLI